MSYTRMIGLAASVAILVGGCAGQRRADAQAAIQKRVEECKALYPPDTHYLDRANCEAPVRRQSMQTMGTYADLVDSYLANRAMIAGEIDAGHLTKEQANVKLSDVALQLNQVADERNQRRASAAAAILSSMPQLSPYQVPAYQMNVPSTVTTNCMRIGNIVNCTSN